MKDEKSNAQHLKDLLTIMKGILPKEGEEAMEFLEAIEEEIIDKGDEIRKLTREIDELEEDDDSEEASPSNESDLGLDTLRWELVNGNIVIDGLMESFIESVQKKYAVVPA